MQVPQIRPNLICGTCFIGILNVDNLLKKRKDIRSFVHLLISFRFFVVSRTVILVSFEQLFLFLMNNCLCKRLAFFYCHPGTVVPVGYTPARWMWYFRVLYPGMAPLPLVP